MGCRLSQFDGAYMVSVSCFHKAAKLNLKVISWFHDNTDAIIPKTHILEVRINRGSFSNIRGATDVLITNSYKKRLHTCTVHPPNRHIMCTQL